MLLFAVLATVLAPTGVLAAAGGAPGPTPREVAEAVAFREKLGFRADRAFVGSTFTRSGFSRADWGVPLDPDEAAEIGRRVKAEKALGRALKAWAREPESAGAYIDQRAGGVPVFLTTGDPARARRELAGLLPAGPGNGPHFARAARSLEQLLALQELINEELRAGALRTLGVVSTSIDVRANAVLLGVAADTPEVRAELAQLYGEGIAVAFEPAAQGGDSCTSRWHCTPAKGGIEIRSTYNGNMCTTAFLVRIAGSPHPRVMTAGHCIEKSGGVGASRTWNSDGRAFGWAEYGHWINGGDADVALLAPANGAISGHRNLVYRASPSDIVGITGWRANAEQVQGSLVCRAGAISGYHCGTISATNRTREVDGKTIDHQWVVDFDACPGDSGGPYLQGTTAFGLHTDSSYGCNPGTNQAWYTPIGWALGVLASRGHPVELCTTSTCGAETNVWTAQDSLDRAVWGPRLVALGDDRILQVGGLAADPVAGPTAAGVEIPAPSAYGPVTDTWSDVASPPWSPADCGGQFAVRLQDGRVLVGGGKRLDSGDPEGCAGAWLFDPDDGGGGSWTEAATPPVALVSAGAVLLQDGRAFVTGGSGSTGSVSVALAYHPGTDEWATLAAAPAGALSPNVLRLPGGRVLVSGGYVLAGDGAGFAHVAATHLYDPGSGEWIPTNGVGAYGRAGIVLSDGRVVLAGGLHLGWNGSQQATFQSAVSVYTPSSGSWSTLTALPWGRAGFTLAELPNGLLLAAGGRVPGSGTFGETATSAHAYDWAAKVWRTAPSLGSARAGQGSAVLDDGRVLVAGGTTASTETYVAGDLQPPTVTPPAHALRSGAQMSATALPIRLSWSATDVGGSGVGTYEVGRSVDGGAFTTIATKVVLPTFDAVVANGHLYRFQVRPRDWAGNAGAWRAGPTFRLNLLQESSTNVSYSSGWKRLTVGGYTGGATRYTKIAGASATFRFSGRGVSFISTKGPTLGGARIYVDGTYAGTVNLHASSWQYRFVAFQRTWGSSGSHSIKVIAMGTSGHPRVDIDGFVVLSNP